MIRVKFYSRPKHLFHDFGILIYSDLDFIDKEVLRIRLTISYGKCYYKIPMDMAVFENKSDADLIVMQHTMCGIGRINWTE